MTTCNDETAVFPNLGRWRAAERRNMFSLGREPQGEKRFDSEEPPEGAADG
jgi:hypothetical protein